MPSAPSKAETGLAARAAIAGILFVSSFFRVMGVRGCRFAPSCSRYAVEAFETMGFFKASAKTLGRIVRCHPFSAGGHDPVHNP